MKCVKCVALCLSKMENLNLIDVKVVDGGLLRLDLLAYLNRQIRELNNLYTEIRDYDFDCGDVYVYTKKVKSYCLHLGYMRWLFSCLFELKIVTKRVYKQVGKEMDLMLNSLTGK